jgi:hypothetical protein
LICIEGSIGPKAAMQARTCEESLRKDGRVYIHSIKTTTCKHLALLKKADYGRLDDDMQHQVAKNPLRLPQQKPIDFPLHIPVASDLAKN